MNDHELVQKVWELNRASIELLSYPMPESDGALGGYEMEARSLDYDIDGLLEECDVRGLERKYALCGVARKKGA